MVYPEVCPLFKNNAICEHTLKLASEATEPLSAASECGVRKYPRSEPPGNSNVHKL